MDDKKIDIDFVKNMYNEMQEIWPQNDKWYQYTFSQISAFLKKIAHEYNFTEDKKILNAGSGGNTYNLPGIHYHIDIAEQKLKDIPNSYVGNIENMPFPSNEFDICICVGSVINYCDAFTAIIEMVRVLKPDGILILDFDQSYSLEFLGTSHFNKAADIIQTFNSGYIDKTWIYSPKYISDILKRQNLKINDIYKYHALTPLIYRITHDENRASKYSKFDTLMSHIPVLKNFSCNIILCAQKALIK